MNVTQLNSKIAVANTRIKTLNEQRQMNIGKKETLTKQLNAAIADYEKKYGVKLTPETIDAEVERVTAQKEKELQGIETVLSMIDSGDFDGATSYIESSKTATAEPEFMNKPVRPQSAKPAVENIAAALEAEEEQTESVLKPPRRLNVQSAVTSTDDDDDMDIPAPPVSPSRVQSQQTAKSRQREPLSGLDTDAKPAPPPSFVPKSPKPTTRRQGMTSFNTILGGTPFNPQED